MIHPQFTMTPNQYQKLAIRTECDQVKSSQKLLPSYNEDGSKKPLKDMLIPIRLNHALHGLSAEAGEAAGWFLKAIYYGKGLTQEIQEKIAEEVGDCLWFCAQALTVLGKDMEEVMRQNIAKLKARFPDKFTDDLSENRNEEAERYAMINPGPVDDKGSIQDWLDKIPEERRLAMKEAAKQTHEMNVAICRSSTHHYTEQLGRCVRCGYTLKQIEESGGKPNPASTGEWGSHPQHGEAMINISQQIQQKTDDVHIKDETDKQCNHEWENDRFSRVCNKCGLRESL